MDHDDYIGWINKTYPRHDRDSCNDADLYNAGTVMLSPRCDRCDALKRLHYWQMEHDMAAHDAALKRKTLEDAAAWFEDDGVDIPPSLVIGVLRRMAKEG